jgi:general secretion pathway protein D
LVTPGSFETREVGVILNATPTVGPDGYSIDLVLAPEVSELEGWINYGSTFGTFVFNIPQPIFNTRKVTTTIVIWDGQTVVMGGLIREQLTKHKDKIPLLGDLPLIGRLFRSDGEYSQKKNLMIFVTARLVDPSGKPIHSANALGVEAAPVGGPVAAQPVP